jgi:hypothetical protein
MLGMGAIDAIDQRWPILATGLPSRNNICNQPDFVHCRAKLAFVIIAGQGLDAGQVGRAWCEDCEW